MTIGAKRHRVSLQNPGDPMPDGDGGYSDTWTPCTPPTKYAEILVASTANLERLAAGSVVLANVTHLVTFTYHPEVTTRTQVIVNGRTFNVASVSNRDLRNIEQTLQCVEVLP
jgi:head-tail adaptor